MLSTVFEPIGSVIVEAGRSRSDRLPGLDLLRSAAIGSVLVHHASLFGLISPDYLIVRFGWMGVDLFFALSGYLIAGPLFRLLAEGKQPNYVSFYMRRLLRILPAYAITVIVYLIFESLRDRPVLPPLWKFMTFTLNIDLEPTPRPALSHAWSLCVEEHFYMLLPIVVYFVAIRPNRNLVILIFASIAVLGIIVRGYVWLSVVAQPPYQLQARPLPDQFLTWIYYPTWTRLDGLVAGVAVAALQAFLPTRWKLLTHKPDHLLVLGAAIVLSSCILFKEQVTMLIPAVFGFPLLSIGMALLVAASANGACIVSRYKIPGVASIAAISYSLYLTHKSVFHLVQLHAAAWPSWAQSAAPAIAGLGAITAGAALFWLVEWPCLRVRDRLLQPSEPIQPWPKNPLRGQDF